MSALRTKPAVEDGPRLDARQLMTENDPLTKGPHRPGHGRQSKIWKYLLTLEPKQDIELPGCPLLYKVGVDPEGRPCVWALVNPASPKIHKRFYAVFTGQPVPESAYLWLGTLIRGELVYHIWIP